MNLDRAGADTPVITAPIGGCNADQGLTKLGPTEGPTYG